MTEPEQHQTPVSEASSNHDQSSDRQAVPAPVSAQGENTTSAQPAAAPAAQAGATKTAAPAASSTSAPKDQYADISADDDLEYASQKKLEYGAMDSDFGPNYNPYLFGKPEKPASQQPQAPQQNGVNPFMAQQNPAQSQQGQQGQPWTANQQGQQPQQGQPGPYPFGFGFNPYAGQAGQTHGNVSYDQYGIPHTNDGHTPRYINGMDVNDRMQNPWYGRWDSYSIIAFVFSILFAVPVLPALMGALGIWRTRTFHMKGKGLAIAAIVINVIYTIAFVWMMINGVSTTDFINSMMSKYSQFLDSSSSNA